MAKSYPDNIPQTFEAHDALKDAYRRGWNHGHGFACHNVPKLGQHLWVDGMGRMKVDAENIRDVHQSLCYSAEENSRSYSPFEFTAHEFNSANDCSEEDDSPDSESLWEAFEAGTSDAIAADLAEYTDDDYGIEEESDAA